MTSITEVGMSELLTSGIAELGITRIEKKSVLKLVIEPPQDVAICYTGPFTLTLGIDCLVVFGGLAVGISFRGILNDVNCELDPALFYQGIRYQLCPDEHQIYYCLWLSSFSKKAIIDAKVELCKEDVKQHQLWLLREKISGKAVEGNGAKVWRVYLKHLLKEQLELTVLTRNKKNAIEAGKIMELEMAAVHLMKVPFKFIIKKFQPQNEKRLLVEGAIEQAEEGLPKRKKISSDLEVEVAITNEKPVRSFVPRTGQVPRRRVNFSKGF